jgi:hypothetical protein
MPRGDRFVARTLHGRTTTNGGAHVVSAMIDSDRNQERSQCRAPFEALDGLGEGQERLVDQILGSILVAHEPPGESPHVLVMKIVRFTHRRDFAGPETLDEIGRQSLRGRSPG